MRRADWEGTPGTVDAESAAALRLLDAALAEIPAAQRQVIVRQFLEGHTQAEIASDLGAPAGTVARRSQLGIERLRKLLARRGAALSAAAAVGLLGAAGEGPSAPAALGARVVSLASGSAATAVVAGIAEGVIKAMFWIKVKLLCKIALPAAAAILLAAGGRAVLAGGVPGETPRPKPAAVEPTPAVPAPETPPAARGNLSARADALRARFAKFYKPDRPALKPPKAPQYQLPLETAKVTNWEKVAGQYLKAEAAAALVRKNGFAAVGFAGDDVVDLYHGLKLRGVPIFVTSDSLLHLYHIQFDETLREIEEREFFNDALGLSKAMYEASRGQQREFGDVLLKEAARRNAAYFAVALECLATDRSAEELEKACAAVANWGKRSWAESRAFPRDFPAAFEMAKQHNPGRPWALSSKDGLLEALKAARAAVPEGKKAVEYELGADIGNEVAAELKLIEKHEGFTLSPIFKYKEDYSQYVPRGHYTRSEKLKRYFKALMWYGRMTMLIKGGEPHGPGKPNLISAKDARIQTTGGLLAADLLRTVKLADGRPAAQVWDRLYAVTAYYVGLADDLTPYEYTDAAAKALGENYKPTDLAGDGDFRAYRLELARLRGPEIYSGTGACEGPTPASAGEADLLKMLEKTKGFRLMGQRYIPDSFIMGRLVYPTVGPWGGGEFAFTTVSTMGGPARGFPRGLDVMAVLGSNRAREIVGELRDDRYPKTRKAKSYDQVIAGLRAQFGAVDEAGWNRNLYWAWLYCLKPLLAGTGGSGGEGLPTFMKTDAWRDKQLNAALASWSQLRHDTILYAKQSYTGGGRGAPRQPKMVEGYVEPVPEFYSRLLALSRMTLEGLKDMKVLTGKSEARMRVVESVLVRLVDISTRELQNEKLGDEDYAFIRGFAAEIKGAVAGVSDSGLQTTIVADVHTDQNSKQVLEEGTGRLRNLVVVYPMPDGGFVAGVGPAFSYYEFRHPMKDRLTDEKWKSMLSGQEKPALPKWTGSFGTAE